MKQHLNRNENTVPEKTESLPRDPLPPLVNHPAGKAAPGDGWVETPRAVENLRDDRQRFIH